MPSPLMVVICQGMVAGFLITAQHASGAGVCHRNGGVPGAALPRAGPGDQPQAGACGSHVCPRLLESHAG